MSDRPLIQHLDKAVRQVVETQANKYDALFLQKLQDFVSDVAEVAPTDVIELPASAWWMSALIAERM